MHNHALLNSYWPAGPSIHIFNVQLTGLHFFPVQHTIWRNSSTDSRKDCLVLMAEHSSKSGQGPSSRLQPLAPKEFIVVQWFIFPLPERRKIFCVSNLKGVSIKLNNSLISQKTFL
ncbi:hypothetical protein XELAEV_18037315mg [Xenopus laevis]|uniref:Uncharacterized protein n=1 Tax=Xenopus laevis TaxID=8355 RepID=A0A974HA23_XENLA|nr:hypothetical protein XELAEV_18037315mg [Xenopus laevis]